MRIDVSQLPVYSVSQVNRYIKDKLDGDGLLSGLLVRGELSNYKRYPSGHHYFTLKDAQGALRCVMFRGDAARLRFRPENGMQVVAFGRVTVYPRDGQYQLYCTELFTDGQGDLNAAFERLKEKLAAEGLFDPAAKKPLPRYPRRIALVTSPAGAAVRDMLRVLKARWPMAEVLVAPVRVQGEEAAGEIAAAIHALNNRADIDLIITGRGGGSLEDLWAFNEEVVARAVFVSNIPVISAVGHEPDVTIVDYVADLRAATPSNAAELAVPDQNEIFQLLDQLQARLGRALDARVSAQRQRLERVRLSRAWEGRVSARRQRLEYLKKARVLRDMKAPIEDRRGRVALLRERLAAAGRALPVSKRSALARLCAGLEAMSPLRVLARGYSLARTGRGVLTSVDQAEPGDSLTVVVADGRLQCRVEGKEKVRWPQKSS